MFLLQHAPTPSFNTLQAKFGGTRREVPNIAGATPRAENDQTSDTDDSKRTRGPRGDPQHTSTTHPALFKSKNIASDAEQTAERGNEPLKEWAAEARKSGRVDSLATTPKRSMRERQMSNDTHNNRNDTDLLTLHGLERARVQANKALLAGNVTDTLEMCQQILQQWPSDGATLLYQGEAMAQSGGWDVAWNRMERILASSNGVEEIVAPATVRHPAVVDDSRRSLDGSARLAASPKPPRAPEILVPLDTALAAAGNLAVYARARTPQTLDENAEIFFLVEGLREAAERSLAGYDRKIGAASKTSLFSPESGGDGREAGEAPDNVSPTGSLSENTTNEDYYGKVGGVDGYTDVLFLLAPAFEAREQLTAALRLYQRAILLGWHQDHRPHHGLAEISRRLLQRERERTRRRSTTRVSETPIQSSFSSPLSLSTPPRPHSQTGPGQLTTSASMSDATVSGQQQQPQQRRSSCDWDITFPRPGQVFSPEDTIQVEFDLALLDPGLPSAGSLFKTLAIGAGTSKANDIFPTGSVQEGGRGGIDITEDGLGLIACSYLEGFTVAHRLPRGQLRDIGIGWHLLTAEVYQLPSLRPFSCPAGSDISKNGSGESRCARLETSLASRSNSRVSPIETLVRVSFVAETTGTGLNWKC